MSRHKIDTPEKRAIVKQIVRDNPNVSNRKIARLLYHKHKALFPSVEAARMCVMVARGARGAVLRKSCKVIGRTPRPSEVLRLPKAVSIPSTPHTVAPGRTLILNDVHLPFHDRLALEAAIRLASKMKIDTVLLNGDLIDFFSISRYLSDPSKRDLIGELKTAEEFLMYIRGKFRGATIILKEGNHEERWDHYVWQKAPELCQLPHIRLDKIINAEAHGVQVIGDRLPVNIGHLTVLHGHELPQGAASPVNPARGLFIRMVSTAAIGHQHRTSEHAEKVGIGGGRFITCWSIGCLCDLSPMYARVNKWNHGFAIVESAADGTFQFHNKRIHDGRVL